MKTYNDLIAVGESESAKMEFIASAIQEHKTSGIVRVARDAEMYYRHLNPTIMRAQKIVYDLLGRAQPDLYSANHKIPSRFYFYFITQAVQFLLGNGVSFTNEATKEKLGKSFDNAIQQLATRALNGGVAFGFWNADHLEVFSIAGGEDEPAFVPLYDEDNGALRSGVRYWQIASDKPLRATLYEEDGYTEYIKRKGEQMTVLFEKRPYVQVIEQSEYTGANIAYGYNYGGFPIIPMFNVNRQSEIIGSRETLDSYDLMLSTMINNVDEGNLIYWIIKNADGMTDMDDMKFIQRLKTIRVAHADSDEGGAEVEDHKVEAPFEANETALERLRKQLFDDFMALDIKDISGGATTATQIKAAYEPLNQKTDMFEYQVTDFIERLLALIGIEDSPAYTRSTIVNKAEEVQTVLSAAEYLSEDYITKKVLEVMGDIDKAEEVIANRINEDMSRFEGEE